MKAFKKHPSIQINEKIQLDLYQSRNSKLRIAVSNIPGPMVHCYLNFVTEANNDDGLPHCLEHMVFMGCEKYKGNLDEITNRCLSETQGVTRQTNTFYELISAGTMGFLKALPAYIHYLLNPMLTPSQFTTEVHHIDGEGYDSGVIYDEQSGDGFSMEQQRRKLFYPKYSGYAYNHGGSQKNLRETCSLKNIRRFHKQFYHLDNLFIIVCGMVNHNQLLYTIAQVECEYIKKIPKNFERPFQRELTEFKLEPNKAEIIVPSDFDDDEYGRVDISWKGPPLSNFYQWKALLVLINYLNDISSKKRKMGIFRTEEELLYEFTMEQLHYEIVARFGNVRIEKMDTNFKENFLSKIRMEHKKIDVEKICQIIEQHKRNYVCELEKNAHEMIRDGIFAYQLYGTKEEQLEERINEMKMLNCLKTENSEFWCKLFHETFNERCFYLFAKLSKKEYEKLEKKEKQRINKRLKTIHLKAKKDELEAAIKENERNKFGDYLLKELILNEIEQFSLFRVETIKNGMDIVAPNLLPKLPFHYFHKMESEIFQITIIFDTNSLSNEDRNFLLLWSKLIFQSPAKVDGKSLSSEEVEKLTNCELISKKCSIGISGSYERFMFFKLRAHNQNFKYLPKWAEIFLGGTMFDAKRVKDCAAELRGKAMVEDIDEMSNILWMASAYNKNSNKIVCNFLALQQFHYYIGYEIKEENLIEKLEEVRKKILSSIVNIHFIGDPAKLPEKDWLEQNWNFLSNQAEKMEFEYQPDFEQNWEMMGIIRAIETKRSDFVFMQIGKYEGTWKDAILPKGNTMEILLLEKYLCQNGGPIWNAIRGSGSAYKCPSICLHPDRKSIKLKIKCNDFKEFKRIYEETKNTVKNILDIGELEEKLFITAKGLLIHDFQCVAHNLHLIMGDTMKMPILNEITTKVRAWVTFSRTSKGGNLWDQMHGKMKLKTTKLIMKTAKSAILETIRNVGPNFTQELCNRIWKAKAENVFQKAAPTFRDLFDDTKSIRCIALNKSSIGKMKKSFDKVEICSLKDFQTMPDFLNELNETEKTEIDELEMSEFFNAINEQEEIEAENAKFGVIRFEEFWTQDLIEEARIRVNVNICIWTPNLFDKEGWPIITVDLSNITRTCGKLYWCKLSKRVICQLLDIDENQKPSMAEFNNILPDGIDNIRQKIVNKMGLIFEIDKKHDCGSELCSGQIMSIIGL